MILVDHPLNNQRHGDLQEDSPDDDEIERDQRWEEEMKTFLKERKEIDRSRKKSRMLEDQDSLFKKKRSEEKTMKEFLREWL